MQAGLKIDPNDINSINAMGNALQFKWEYDAAIEIYSKAIELAPTCAEAHNNLGNASENQGNLQPAVKSYTQALVYQPENKATQNNLIRARQQLGRRLRAAGLPAGGAGLGWLAGLAGLVCRLAALVGCAGWRAGVCGRAAGARHESTDYCPGWARLAPQCGP